MATSKNYFLRIWVEDFGSEKVMEKTAYFVYGGFFIAWCSAQRIPNLYDCQWQSYLDFNLGQKIRPNPKRGVFRGALMYGLSFAQLRVFFAPRLPNS